MASNQTIIVKSRCAYTDADGKRCKTITSITHPFCPDHTRHIYGVEVRPSQITAAGLGLWAVRDIKRNTHLFNYEGERLLKREYNERYEDSHLGVYGIELNRRIVIDACRTDSGIARYICSYQGSGQKPNIKYESDGKVIEMITTRFIKAGEEILGDYGEEMMTALGVE
ncbi:MAG: SET domain-containing protein [Bacteriodetes bacterium]|nr:SET domain-containing protein [Bacteroidota bacterium]